LNKYRDFDNYLKEFAAATDRVIYGDLTAFGKLNSDEFYVEDKVHYNQKGYDLFAEFFRDLLRDELARY
jgi:lysophospholipase L1-like esterase